MTIPPFFTVRGGARRGEVLVTRAKPFEAAHAYRDPAFGRATRVHGHNYVVTATIGGPIDPSTELLAAFRDLDGLLADLTAPPDHHRIDVQDAPPAGREAGAEAPARPPFPGPRPRV